MRDNDFCKIMDQISLDELTSERIFRSCMRHRHVNKISIRFSRHIAAAILIGLCLAIPVTVYAAVNAYQAYMERMSREEVTDREEKINQGEREADCFSRALSDAERKRLESLRADYEAGICFPSKSMEMVDVTDADFVEPARPYYDYRQMIFYLPKEELTEDELLQIIDVWEKGNYSLSVTAPKEELADDEAVAAAKAQMEKWKKTVEVSDEERIRQFVSQLHLELYDIDLANADWEVRSYGEQDTKYLVKVEHGSEIFSVVFTKDSTPSHLIVETLHYSNGQEAREVTYSEEKVAVMMQEISDRLLRVLSESFLDGEEMVKCQYGYHSQDRKYYVLVYEDSVGNRYRCTGAFMDGRIREILGYEAGQFEECDLLIGCDKIYEEPIVR